VDGLFPGHEPKSTSSPLRPGTYDFTRITESEIKARATKIPSGKAPGLDGVPYFVIKEIAKSKP